MPDADFNSFVKSIEKKYPWLPKPIAHRYSRAYGTRLHRLLNNAQSLTDLGHHLGDSLYEAEVTYLINQEWALTDDDILWRRSKLGLHISDETAARLRAWLTHNSNSEAGERLQA